MMSYSANSSSENEIGSGSGYLLAVVSLSISLPPADYTDRIGYVFCKFHHLTRSPTGNSRVTGIDHLPSLVRLAKENLDRTGIDTSCLQVVLGDGRLGFPGESFDVIHVGAAAAAIPEPLVSQLAKGGRMWIPVIDANGTGQSVWIVDKDEMGRVSRTRMYGVNFVLCVSIRHYGLN